MPIYPDQINKIAGKPAFAGKLARKDAIATAASFECGSFIRFELAEIEGKIGLAYLTNGCGFLVAAADIISEELGARPLSELHGLDDDELAALIQNRLGQKFPD